MAHVNCRAPAKIRLRILMVLLSFPVGSAGASGQAIPTMRLDGPEVSYSRDFTDLRSLRALSDNRVIVVEGVGGQVVMLAADGRGESPVGQRGEGPAEYIDPSRAIPLADSDLTLLVDEALERLLIVGPSGQVMVSEPWRLPDATSPQARDAMEGTYFDETGLVRTDRAGNVIEGPAPLMKVTPGAAPDTIALVTVHDLAARWAASPVSRMFSPGPGGVAKFSLARSPFGAQDEWALTPDGRIVIARARPYRLEILPQDGGRPTLGAIIQYEPIPVTRADRDAFIAALGRGQAAGGGSFSFEGGGTRAVPRSTPSADDLQFPETKPAFPFNALFVGPAGEIFVQRAVPHDADHTLVDVFDGAGWMVRQIQLPADRKVVGAGPGSLFAVRYNEFDVQILERYRVGG